MITKYKFFETIITSSWEYECFDHLFKDQEKLKNKPKFLFHITDKLDEIKKNGLSIDFSKQHKYVKGIYLSNSFWTAYDYNWNLEENYHMLQIPFDNLDTKFMKPDDYELFDMIDLEWPSILEEIGIDKVYGNELVIWKSLDYRHSLYICNQLIYIKNIPFDLVSNVYDKDQIKEQLKLNDNKF